MGMTREPVAACGLAPAWMERVAKAGVLVIMVDVRVWRPISFVLFLERNVHFVKQMRFVRRRMSEFVHPCELLMGAALPEAARSQRARDPNQPPTFTAGALLGIF